MPRRRAATSGRLTRARRKREPRGQWRRRRVERDSLASEPLVRLGEDKTLRRGLQVKRISCHLDTRHRNPRCVSVLCPLARLPPSPTSLPSVLLSFRPRFPPFASLPNPFLAGLRLFRVEQTRGRRIVPRERIFPTRRIVARSETFFASFADESLTCRLSRESSAFPVMADSSARA